MTTLIRWNPVRRPRLINEFDRLFEAPPLWQAPRNWGLELDVTEKGDVYTVKASVPGLNPDDIEITLEDNTLTIQGEYVQEEENENERYHLRERRTGSFSRTVNFPVLVNAAAVEAQYEHGVLTLTVPKAEEVKPKRIGIKVNGNS
ncbi:MAG: Hsp20/alpha crystallin family protein [Ardenticatenaceae bacterium]|nr:Hsp20/alpha crystallin family protein [Ardenticatenaceae bacterium]